MHFSTNMSWLILSKGSGDTEWHCHLCLHHWVLGNSTRVLEAEEEIEVVVAVMPTGKVPNWINIKMNNSPPPTPHQTLAWNVSLVNSTWIWAFHIPRISVFTMHIMTWSEADNLHKLCHMGFSVLEVKHSTTVATIFFCHVPMKLPSSHPQSMSETGLILSWWCQYCSI